MTQKKSKHIRNIVVKPNLSPNSVWDKVQLQYWFESSTNQIFKDFRAETLSYRKNLKRRIFIDRKSPVLLVAHLDTIYQPTIQTETATHYFGTGFDDRLGCWIAYILSEKLKTDLLLTDLEENCQSTAKYHSCKKYNWIAEFDRKGNDVVTYGLQNKKWEKDLSEFWLIGQGTFSDINFLKTNICRVNIGIGYYNEHTKYSFATKEIIQQQIEKFEKFFAKHKDERYIQDFGLYQIKRTKPDQIMLRYNKTCSLCNDYGTIKVGDYELCTDCLDILVLELRDEIERKQETFDTVPTCSDFWDEYEKGNKADEIFEG